MGLLFTIIGGLIVFTVIVLVHELGHFIVAKKSGVKVEEFAVGLPPRIWSKKKGETTYAINAIPFGGYVKLLGEDGAYEDDPRSMASKPAYTRFIILVAGVTFNLLLAYILIVGSYIVGMSRPIIPGLEGQPGVKNTMQVEIQGVEKGTPADKQGLQNGDIIESVEGSYVKDTASVIQDIQNKVNRDNKTKINMVIVRNGREITKSFSTYKAKEKVGNKEVSVNRIGVILDQKGKISASPLVAIRAGFSEVGYFITYYIKSLVQVLDNILTKYRVPSGVAGPVGIFQLSGDAVQSGVSIFIQWIALLSAAIGIVNIMPILPLDGGHLLIVIVESIMRKKVPQNVKLSLSLAGWAVFGIFLVVITLNDLKII